MAGVAELPGDLRAATVSLAADRSKAFQALRFGYVCGWTQNLEGLATLLPMMAARLPMGCLFPGSAMENPLLW